PRASSEPMSISATQGISEPPIRRGWSTRIRPDSLSSRIDSSGQRRKSSARLARSLSRGTMARARFIASSGVRTSAGARATAWVGNVDLDGRGGGFLSLRRLGCREIELDGEAVGILDEYLMQSKRGHRALEKADVVATAPLEHRGATGHGERDMIQPTGAARERVGIPVAHRLDEALRIVGIDTHDVHDPVVALRVIEVGRRLAVVEP